VESAALALLTCATTSAVRLRAACAGAGQIELIAVSAPSEKAAVSAAGERSERIDMRQPAPSASAE
jgi:hypothetical protein